MFHSPSRPATSTYLSRGPPVFPRPLFRRPPLHVIELIGNLHTPGLQIRRGEVVVRSGSRKNLVWLLRETGSRASSGLTETRQQNCQRQGKNYKRAHRSKILSG